MRRRRVLFVLTAAVVAPLLPRAAPRGHAQPQGPPKDGPPVYGRELMTPEELEEHRRKMRSFRTDAEREAYRREHHERMKQRAKERGVTLPEAPPPRRGGPGPGMGKGRGRGPGGPPPSTQP